jgi:hypothetical protein
VAGVGIIRGCMEMHRTKTGLAPEVRPALSLLALESLIDAGNAVDCDVVSHGS